jgi:serine/threonine-protein phosphatase 2A regulatory subunit B'
MLLKLFDFFLEGGGYRLGTDQPWDVKLLVELGTSNNSSLRKVLKSRTNKIMQSLKSLFKRINSSNTLERTNTDESLSPPPELKDESESETSRSGGSFKLKGGSARGTTAFGSGTSVGAVGGTLDRNQVFPASRKIKSSENLAKKANSVKMTAKEKDALKKTSDKLDLKHFAASPNNANVPEEKADGGEQEDGDKHKKNKKGKTLLKEYLAAQVPDAAEVLLHQTLPRIIEKQDWDSQQDVFLKKVRACRAQVEFKTEIEIRSNAVEKFASISEDAKATFPKTNSASKSHSQSPKTRLTQAQSVSVSISDHTDENANMKAMKKRKTEYLLEITEYLNFAPLWFNMENGKELFSTICVNIFRPLPASPYEKLLANGNAFGAAEDPGFSNQVFEDPAMVHLLPVYQILLRIVTSVDIDVSLLKKLISRPFVEKLCENFLSEDRREREMVKAIVHKIYGKFNTYRTFIRKVFQNQFIEFVYESDHHPGIAEILEILGSIISGYAVPLRKEHKQFLIGTLLPLIQCSKFSEYQMELVVCFSEFIAKEPMFAKEILIGIVSKWPISGTAAKQVAFVELLDSILQITTSECFKETIPFVAPIIAKCIRSSSILVAEKILCLWSQDYTCQLLFVHRQTILPIVFTPLWENTQKHWATPIKEVSEHVLNAFREVDKKLYNSCKDDYQKKNTKGVEAKSQ